MHHAARSLPASGFLLPKNMSDFRIYFNRKNEAPQVWSVDQGDQSSEINVKEWRLHRCNADSHYEASVKVNPDTPTAWIVVMHAIMRVEHGVAHFFHDPDWRVPRISQQIDDRLDELP